MTRTVRSAWLPVLAASAVLLRLPYLARPLTPDEGGFLLVAGQWHAGASLYGNYWVDRPPLLIALFRLAEALGGQGALRLLGALAAAVSVACVWVLLRRVVGPRSAVAGAATTLALLVSPLNGAAPVNGELLAAPFIAAGLALAVLALDTRRLWTAAGSGASAAAAVLVKQNMVDVVVFMATALAVAWLLRGRHHRVPVLRVTALFTGGFLLVVLVVLGIAWTRGSPPDGVLYAMYPFRWDAAQVIGSGGLSERSIRLRELLLAELLTLTPLVLIGLLVVLVRRRRSAEPMRLITAAATSAVAIYGMVSILAGGSYWLHYLVQLAVPTGIAAGLLVGWLGRRAGAAVVLPVVLSALVSWSLGLTHTPVSEGDLVGAAIGRVAGPGDTMVSVLGDPATVQASGLRSPYPYLWSLPARTLDPGLRELRETLRGPRAPTWVVLRQPGGDTLLRGESPLEHRYRLVEEVCERRLYLRADTLRRTPAAAESCRSPSLDWLTELFTDLDEEFARH